MFYGGSTARCFDESTTFIPARQTHSSFGTRVSRGHCPDSARLGARTEQRIRRTPREADRSGECARRAVRLHGTRGSESLLRLHAGREFFLSHPAQNGKGGGGC